MMSIAKIHNMSVFGERLASLRKSLNLSQAAFGSKLGLSQGFIGNCERGAANLTLEHIIRIANEFGVDLNWLVAGKTTLASNLDPVLQEIISTSQRLDDQGRHEVLRSAKKEYELQSFKELTKIAIHEVRENDKALEVVTKSDRPAEISKEEPVAGKSTRKKDAITSSKKALKS